MTRMEAVVDDLELSSRGLFGNALRISVPSRWSDVSLVRQVPDHQEVFQDVSERSSVQSTHTSSMSTSCVGTKGILGIEILERQSLVTDHEAASYFFHDLVEENDSERSKRRENNSTNIMYTKVWNVGYDSDMIPGTSEREWQCDGQDYNLMPRLTQRLKACSLIGSYDVQRKNNIRCFGLSEHSSFSEETALRVRTELCVVRIESVQTDLLITMTIPEDIVQHMSDINSFKSGTSSHSQIFRKVLASFEILDYSLFA